MTSNPENHKAAKTDAAKVPLPWGINTIASMVGASGVKTSPDGKSWVRSVPVPYSKNWRETLRAAWWILTGKAEAVVWPASGDLERFVGEVSQGGTP